MVIETNIRKKVEKREDKHVEEKGKEKGKKKKEDFVHLEQQRQGKTRETFVGDKTGNSTVRVRISSMYFYLQVFLQCVSYLEHISRLHLFPELAANS